MGKLLPEEEEKKEGKEKKWRRSTVTKIEKTCIFN